MKKIYEKIMMVFAVIGVLSIVAMCVGGAIGSTTIGMIGAYAGVVMILGLWITSEIESYLKRRAK